MLPSPARGEANPSEGTRSRCFAAHAWQYPWLTNWLAIGASPQSIHSMQLGTTAVPFNSAEQQRSRREVRHSNNIADIESSGADSALAGLQTMRMIDPLQPDYQWPSVPHGVGSNRYSSLQWMVHDLELGCTGILERQMTVDALLYLSNLQLRCQSTLYTRKLSWQTLWTRYSLEQWSASCT